MTAADTTPSAEEEERQRVIDLARDGAARVLDGVGALLAELREEGRNNVPFEGEFAESDYYEDAEEARRLEEAIAEAEWAEVVRFSEAARAARKNGGGDK